MNIACDGLFKFYAADQMTCAREHGFSNLDQLKEARRSDPDSNDALQRADECIFRTETRWQLTSIDYTISFSNKKSLARNYSDKNRDQITAIVFKYVNKKAKAKIQGKPPS